MRLLAPRQVGDRQRVLLCAFAGSPEAPRMPPSTFRLKCFNTDVELHPGVRGADPSPEGLRVPAPGVSSPFKARP